VTALVIVIGFALLCITAILTVTVSVADAKDSLPHARKCSRCGEYCNSTDRWLAENGARVTHGICKTCKEAMDEDIDALTKPEVTE
jgi:hypothetical protein